MACFHLFIASLTALFTSFLTLSPIILHGLVPWMDTLGTHPVAPTPPASPQVFFTPDLWEVFPTANLSVPVVSVPVDPVPVDPVPVDPVLVDPVPLSTSTFPFHLDEENEEPFAMPPPEEPTVEELLRELRRLLKLTLLCMTLDFEDFIRRNPYLRSEKPDCRLRQLFWTIPPQYRSRSRGRSVPCSPSQSRFPVRTRAVSASPALPSAPAPAPASTLPGSPSPPSASPAPSTSSTDQSGRPSIVERLRPGIERRKDLQRILELEKQVEDLILEIAELQKLQLSPAQPVLVMGSVPPPPPPAQPVLVTGSVLPPPRPAQPVLVTGSVPSPPPPAQPVLVMGSVPPPPPPAQPVLVTGSVPPPPRPAQPVLVTGSVPPPPPSAQPVLVMGSVPSPPSPAQPVLVRGSVPPPPRPAQPVLVMGSASALPPTAALAPPFQPSSSRYPAPPPPPQPLSFRQPHPRTLGQAGPRPDQFSMEAFVKKYPQTGKKLG